MFVSSAAASSLQHGTKHQLKGLCTFKIGTLIFKNTVFVERVLAWAACLTLFREDCSELVYTSFTWKEWQGRLQAGESTSFPNLKAEAFSACIIQVTKPISEFSGKAQIASKSHNRHVYPEIVLRNQLKWICSILNILQQLPVHLPKSMPYSSGSSYTIENTPWFPCLFP